MAQFEITTLELGPMENFIYLIKDEQSGRAAVVDPAWDVAEILKTAEQQEVKITDILLTHSHHDHINGIDALLNHCDAELHLLKAEAQFWGAAQLKTTEHHGGDVFKLGKTEIEVLHTPGHTPGSACYRIEDQLITGDTLFVFGCGRCDMEGGDPEQMFNTLNKMNRELPKHTCIHPGHNYSVHTHTTLAEEQQGNPFMHFDQLDDFVRYRSTLHDKLRDSPYGAMTRAQTLACLKHK